MVTNPADFGTETASEPRQTGVRSFRCRAAQNTEKREKSAMNRSSRSVSQARSTAPHGRDTADLERRYGAIGISAVAAAVHFNAEPEKPATDRRSDELADRFADVFA
jgi:hypothetical protein